MPRGKRRSTRKSMKSSKPMMEEDEEVKSNLDLISDLPECLLVEILSRLAVDQVVKTSLLSKRWRYLWTFTTCLNFDCLEPDKDKAIFIDKFLSCHEKTMVRKLNISIMYEDELALKVDSWVRFAITSGVEEFKLDLTDGDSPEEEDDWDFTLYKLPRSLLKCESLTQLTLSACDLNLPVSFHLRSLKTLILRHIDLCHDAIERLTSSSPILEVLFLKDCQRHGNLNIRIKNGHVKNLVIEDDLDSEYFSVTIYAPKVLSVEFDSVLLRKYRIKNLKSVTCADLCRVALDDFYGDPFYDIDASYNVALFTVLHSLRHVKTLKLSSSCIRALSLRKIEGLELLSLRATNIELDAGFTKWELPGIAYLLQSASSLENLTIFITIFAETEMADEFVEEHDFDEKKYWKLRAPSFSSSVLQNIKKINITGFHRSHSVLDHIASHQAGLEKCLENETEFVRFLLENAKSLERMLIDIDKEGCDQGTALKVMKQVIRKLTGFHKASPNVEILVT